MKRIAYIIEGMYNSGGMERVLSVVANSLCKDYDLTVITLQQKGREHYFKLEDDIHCHDLWIVDIADGKEIKQKLAKYLHEQHFNTVISLGGIDFYYLHSIKDGSRKIFWYHFAIDIAKTTWIGPNPSVAKRIKAEFQTWRRIYHARKYDKIVVISKADLSAWKRYTNNAMLIYNPVTISNAQPADMQSKAVISVGRLDYQKGYDYLIDAWKVVAEKHSDWHLNIYGEGLLREKLQKQIGQLQLTSFITICGRVTNIEDEYTRHSIYVMSSRAEGLGLVLLEAASCGLPLVAFDCPSGPSEIIEDGKNGFLIEKVGDVQGMADRICLLIENTSLRNKMGGEALGVTNKFSISEISKRWMSLLNNM